MNFKTEILPILPQIVIGITVLICFLNYKRFPRYFKAFAFFWLLIFLGELVGHTLRARHMPNLWLYNTTFSIAYLFLPWFINQFPGSENLNKYLKWYFVVFIILLSIDITNKNYFVDPARILLTTTIVFGGVIIISLCAWYLWKIYKSEDDRRLRSDPHFWLTIGFLAYYAGLTPYFGTVNYLVEKYPKFAGDYHLVVTYGFSLIINLSICIAYLCRTPNSQK